MATYTYSIQNDFPNHAINFDSLALQFAAVTDLASLYNGGATNGDACLLYFTNTLSSSQQTELASIIAAHQGQPPTPTPPTVNITLPDGTAYANVVVSPS